MLGIFGRMRGHPLVKFLGWEIRKARVTCLLGCDWWDNISQEWLGWAMPSLLVSPEMHLMHSPNRTTGFVPMGKAALSSRLARRCNRSGPVWNSSYSIGSMEELVAHYLEE